MDILSRSKGELCGFWGDALKASNNNVRWLWRGFLARANVSLLASQWKSGKTTLLSLLLHRMRRGDAFLGQPVEAEESESLWSGRQNKLDLGAGYFACRPFRTKPDVAQWKNLLDSCTALHGRERFDLAVFDTVTTFFPRGAETARRRPRTPFSGCGG